MKKLLLILATLTITSLGFAFEKPEGPDVDPSTKALEREIDSYKAAGWKMNNLRATDMPELEKLAEDFERKLDEIKARIKKASRPEAEMLEKLKKSVQDEIRRLRDAMTKTK